MKSVSLVIEKEIYLEIGLKIWNITGNVMDKRTIKKIYTMKVLILILLNVVISKATRKISLLIPLQQFNRF